jgi:hypothetical protein
MMERELKVLNEQQQKRATGINGLIARGVMPTRDDLRAAGRNVLDCGCPESLLQSVVAKNAERRNAPPRVELRTERKQKWAPDHIVRAFDEAGITKPGDPNPRSVGDVLADIARRKQLLAEVLD